MAFTGGLPAQPRRNTLLDQSLFPATTSLLKCFKSDFQANQVLIDELGATIDGKSHLALCEFQKRGYQRITDLEEFGAFDQDYMAVVKRVKSGQYDLSELAQLLKSRSDNVAFVATWATFKLSQDNAEPNTKVELAMELAAPLMRIVDTGSLKMRSMAVAALTDLGHNCKDARPCIERVQGALPIIQRVLFDGMRLNHGNVKREAIALLVNMSAQPDRAKEMADDEPLLLLLIELFKHEPHENDKEAMEIGLHVLGNMLTHKPDLAKSQAMVDAIATLTRLLTCRLPVDLKKHKGGVRAEAARVLALALERHYVDPYTKYHPVMCWEIIDALLHSAQFGTPYVQTQSIELLRVMLIRQGNAWVASRIVERKAVPELLKCMRVSEECVRGATASLMVHLVASSEDAQSAVVDAGGLEVFSQAVRNGEMNTIYTNQLIASACCVLNTLLTDHTVLTYKLCSNKDFCTVLLERASHTAAKEPNNAKNRRTHAAELSQTIILNLRDSAPPKATGKRPREDEDGDE